MGVRAHSGKRPRPKLVSVVIPLFNEREVVPHLRERLEALADELDCSMEFVLVSDGSTDGTTELLFQWAEEDTRACVIDLSRNFGHQAAITAGLDVTRGDVVVMMDGDLQDPPELIPTLIAKYCEGFDVVYAQRTSRQGETWFKRTSAAGFYWFMQKFVHKNLPRNVGEFRLISRPVAGSLRHLREGHRFIRGMTVWLGYKQVAVPFVRPEREFGATKFPLRKMVRFAWDAILSFSSLPMRMGMYLGLLTCVGGVALGGYSVVRKFLYDDLVPGWSSLIVLVSLLGGANLICLGLVGEYVGRVYEEIKARPLYVIRDSRNIDVKRLPTRGVMEESPSNWETIKQRRRA